MDYRAGVLGGTLAVQKKSSGGVEVVCMVGRARDHQPQSDDDQDTAKAKGTKTDLYR
jgi:hypothetical protein